MDHAVKCNENKNKCALHPLRAMLMREFVESIGCVRCSDRGTCGHIIPLQLNARDIQKGRLESHYGGSGDASSTRTQPGGHIICRPPRMWMCRWYTDWAPFSPSLTTSRKPPRHSSRPIFAATHIMCPSRVQCCSGLACRI